MLVNTSVWLVQLDRTNYGLINPWNNSIYPSYTLDYAKITLFPPVSNQISVPIRENSHPPLLGLFRIPTSSVNPSNQAFPCAFLFLCLIVESQDESTTKIRSIWNSNWEERKERNLGAFSSIWFSLIKTR